MSVQPVDAIFRQVTLPDGRSIGTARIVVRPSGRVGVWRQQQGMIAQAFIGDAVGVESTVGGFQVAKSAQQVTVTVTGGGTVVGREIGCQCGSLPHLVVPDEF